MAKAPPKKQKAKKTGRPKIQINWEEFDKLCTMQCTLEEMASWFGCSEDTLERRCKEDKKLRFADYFKKRSSGGRISLRRSQFKAAIEGNVTMLIWLGKQYLGQKDKIEEADGNKAGDIIETMKAIGERFPV